MSKSSSTKTTLTLPVPPGSSDATHTAPSWRHSPLARLAKAFGLDRAIAYTVLARGWSACAGLITVALIARTMSTAEQGYYYTFGSLVAMQIVFELGFSVVILQLASHEAAHLVIEAHGVIAGPGHHHSRLASVFRKAIKWYSFAALLMGLLLIPIGWHFFATSLPIHPGADHPTIGWHTPWIAVVIASCITFQIDPIFSFLEGCGFVAASARARLAQSITGGLLAWTALLLGHGLFAPAMLIFGQAIAGLVWIGRRHRLLRQLMSHPVGQHAIDWWQEVWPFQWRIAVSYACGFFIFQLFNPILFRYWGPTAAGQMGMSLNITNAIASIAIAWINTKAAPFGAMIARREFKLLDRIFFRSVAQTMLLCAVGSLIVWSAALYLSHSSLPFARRILPPLPFAFLLVTMNINQLVSSMAIYLRAHKQEKFLSISVIGAVCVIISAYFLGRNLGAIGMTAGQVVIALFVGLGAGSFIFFKYRRLWHA